MAKAKLFSLYDNSSITLSPGSRHIPSDQLSKLLSAKQMVDSTKKATIEFKKKQVAETEQLKEKAASEGYAEGLERWTQEMSGIEDEIAKARKEFEQAILAAAMAAAKKFVGREIEQNPSTLVEIVTKSLKAVAQHKKIIIYCSKKDFELLDAARPDLKKLFEQLESLTVAVKEGIDGYIIETERGIINHGNLDELWNALEKAFGSALAKAPLTASTETN